MKYIIEKIEKDLKSKKSLIKAFCNYLINVPYRMSLKINKNKTFNVFKEELNQRYTKDNSCVVRINEIFYKVENLNFIKKNNEYADFIEIYNQIEGDKKYGDSEIILLNNLKEDIVSGSFYIYGSYNYFLINKQEMDNNNIYLELRKLMNNKKENLKNVILEYNRAVFS